MLEIIAVRHTSVDILPGTCYGITDVPVVASTFQSEADAVKQQLSLLAGDFDAIFTSPLSRCTLLASTCGFPSAIIDSRLMEMNFGDWEMQRYDAITDPRLQLWYDDWLNVSPTNGESFSQQFQRVSSFVEQQLAHGRRRILIFTHAGVIIQFLRLSGLTVDQSFAQQPKYGQLQKIILQNQK